MSYRLAQRADFATGLTTQHALIDFWGVVAIPAQTHIESQAREESLLARELWIWEGEEPSGDPPRDTERPSSFRQWQEREIESIRRLTLDEDALPANFLAIIWRHSLNIAAINDSCPWHPLALLGVGSHPSNALRNAYASATLADRMSRALGLPKLDRHSITAAALTMNWKIFHLQDRLSSSKNGLSQSDMQAIKTHPIDAANLLRSMGLDNLAWLHAVEHHHEEPDGRGYPGRLTRESTSLGGQILRACDRFVALTSSRRFRAGILTQEATLAIEQIVPCEDGIRSALLGDIAPHPPGGFWTDPKHHALWICLGRDAQGRNMALALNPRIPSAPQPMEGFRETARPLMDEDQYRLGRARLDEASAIPAKK